MEKTDDDINSPENAQKRIEQNLLFGVMKELYELEGQPRLQLFVTHGFLELIVSILIRAKTKNGKKISSDIRSYPYSAQILILNEVTILSNEEFKVLDWFRKMRNRAAHETLFEITNNDLSKIKNRGKKVQVEDFTELCRMLIISLTNGKFEILGPQIMPTLGPWDNTA